MEDLVSNLRKGSRLALSRILTQVERETEQGQFALRTLYPETGKAHKIGITGPPGSGKSTLVNALAKGLGELAEKPKVAIIAVDPTSPFTGGAILGDRVRMLDIQGDPGIFIRSMASRGSLGGLSNQTEAFSQVFDAAGFDYILIETVGAGQSEVEIAKLAHTTVVVEVPGLGDDIQSIKAGILEIADILVVNKSDHPGADQSVRNLRNMLELGYSPNAIPAGKHRLQDSPTLNEPVQNQKRWIPPILKTIASEGRGVADLTKAVKNHAKFLRETGQWKDRDAYVIRENLNKLILASLFSRWENSIPNQLYGEVLAAVIDRQISPHEAVERLLTYNQNKKSLSLES